MNEDTWSMETFDYEIFSLRELYDCVVQTNKELGIKEIVGWDDFKRGIGPLLLRQGVPENYSDYEVKVSKEGKIQESYNNIDREIDLNSKN